MSGCVEQYFTVEDIFFKIGQEHSENNRYPNVHYNSIVTYMTYKRRDSIEPKTRMVLNIFTPQESDIMNKFDTLLINYIEPFLSDYSCFKVKLDYNHELISVDEFVEEYPDFYSTLPQEMLNEWNAFVLRFKNWVEESKDIWIKKFDIYAHFDYESFLDEPDKIITKQDIETPRVAKTRVSERMLNDTPEEEGDFTGEGYANQYEKITNTDNVATGTNQFDSTIGEHDPAKVIDLLNKNLNAVRNLYRQWMLDFRSKVLID